MNFEYNSLKSKSNKGKHGIDFEEAKELWFNDNVVLPALTRGESRYMIIGKLGESVYSCIFMVRKTNIRIISCRKVRSKEKKVCYEKIKEIS